MKIFFSGNIIGKVGTKLRVSMLGETKLLVLGLNNCLSKAVIIQLVQLLFFSSQIPLRIVEQS